MGIDQLKKFMVIAQYNHLTQAAQQLHLTPAALSKVIRRLEKQLNTQLFDRVGRNIRLNRQGQKLLQYAAKLVHETEQMISEFSGDAQSQTITVAGPSLLMQAWLPEVMRCAEPWRFRFQVQRMWEGDALKHLINGYADVALVTQFATDQMHRDDLASMDLRRTVFHVAAGSDHPLVSNLSSSTVVTTEALVEHDFISPTVSPFCGINRGEHSDGWAFHQIVRKLHYRCNDFSVLLSVVEQGLALAYLPDFVIEAHDLVTVPWHHDLENAEETIQLVYRPSAASGYLNRLMQACVDTFAKDSGEGVDMSV